jgi:hypothetical protein
VIRRRTSALALAVLLPLVSLTAASCATFDTQRVAAVNERELSQDDLTVILEHPIGQQLAQSAPIEGIMSGSSVRAALSVWILVEAFDQAGQITQDLLDQATANIGQGGPVAEYESAPPVVKDLALRLTAIQVGIQSGLFSIDEISAAAADADISVDSVYGFWDDAAASVIPMG